MKKHLYFLLLASFLLLAGCSKTSDKSQKTPKLDPNNPVSLKVWHYYNGAQQKAFNELVTQFNSTKGKEMGIYVEGYSKGSVADLEKSVKESANGVVGAEKLPDIFSSYADTAVNLQKKDLLVDLTKYFTPAELSEYVDSYIEEGYFTNNKELYLFPTAKSTEIIMMNVTDWEPFAKATGYTYDDLRTTESITKVAEAYYNWSNGKAFYGRDSMSNYFVMTFIQLGAEIVGVVDGKPVVCKDKEKYRAIWDNFYVPFMKGYFTALGKFRSDDIKTGDLLAYTGSSSSSTYFPSKVDANGEEKFINCVVLPAPVMENGKQMNVQQGAGMAVTKSDPIREYASCIFIKWFTETDNNIRFACESSYLPVKKAANKTAALDDVISKYNLRIKEKTYKTTTLIMDSFENTTYYTPKTYDTSFAVRKVLDYNLSDQAKADKKAIDEKVKAGVPREEATAPYISEEAFEKWYLYFTELLETKIKG